MIGLLLAMYPAGWRRRYGEEFRAVLESRPLGPFDVADVFLGALDARLGAARLAGERNDHGGLQIMLRIGGFGAIVGGSLWVAGLFIASGLGGDADPMPFVVMIFGGTLGLLLALIGLSAFQAHADPKLAWLAFAVPAIGTVVSLVGLFGMLTVPDGDAPMVGALSPWSIWMIGLLGTLIGSLLFAIASVQARVLSRAGAQGLAISSAGRPPGRARIGRRQRHARRDRHALPGVGHARLRR